MTLPPVDHNPKRTREARQAETAFAERDFPAFLQYIPRAELYDCLTAMRPWTKIICQHNAPLCLNCHERLYPGEYVYQATTWLDPAPCLCFHCGLSWAFHVGDLLLP